LHPDFPTAVAEMTRIRDTFDPRPAHRAVYEELYQRVYKQMYRRLRPLYEEIREITGYPPR
jgi:ribulose kinase